MSQKSRIRLGVVMAGGAGERFWPVSRHARPKQLLALTRPDVTMLAEAVHHLSPVVGENNVHIVTGKHLEEAIRTALPGLAANQIIAEPSKRNTAGALAYAAAYMLARYVENEPDDITLAITTADHRIGDPALFARTIETAIGAAEQHDALVTCGITPTHAETGFGYIEIHDTIPVFGGAEGTPAVYRTCGFREKPDATLAREYLKSGRHFWNSGMFIWKLSTFLAELEQASPNMAIAVHAMAQSIRKDTDDLTCRIFDQIEPISIDYALMEKSHNVLVVKGTFPWADIGAWNALAAPDNCCVGDPVVVDSSGCVVYNEVGADAMAVGVVGMKDTVVVVTGDAVLVMPCNRAQDVRAIVDELKKRNAPQL